MASNKGVAGLIAFFGVAQAAFAISIIAIIAAELYDRGGWALYYGPRGNELSVYYDGTCLMSNNSINVCAYGYATAVIGICFSIGMVAAAFVPGAIAALLAAFNSLWWLAYSITATVYSDNIEDGDYLWKDYNKKYRHDVYALSWTTFATCVVCLALSCAIAKKKEEKYDTPAAQDVPQYKVHDGAAPQPMTATVV